MKNALVLTMTVCVLAAVAICGCATGPKGPTPEELVMQQTKNFAADFQAVKADKILDYVSDSFTNERVASKKELADHLQKAKDSGQVAKFGDMIKEHNGQIDLAQAKVTIKGDTAVVYPITASANEGSVTVELDFKLDKDKVWRIAGINVEGI